MNSVAFEVQARCKAAARGFRRRPKPQIRDLILAECYDKLAAGVPPPEVLEWAELTWGNDENPITGLVEGVIQTFLGWCSG